MSYLLYSQAELLKLPQPVPVTLHPDSVYLSSLSEKLITAIAPLPAEFSKLLQVLRNRN